MLIKLNPNINAHKIKVAQLDLTDFSSLDKRFSEIIVEANWNFDIFVNNAGINGGSNFPETIETEYDVILNTNLKGTYFFSQIITKYLLNNKIKGNILFILSSSSLRPGNSPYIISKWGERSLMLGLAKKLIRNEIIVNAIAPGPTSTKMLISKGSNLHLDRSPSKRYVTAEEVANFATILVSKMGSMVIGDTIFLTGGSAITTIDDIQY